jgi:hypothetical protein
MKKIILLMGLAMGLGACNTGGGDGPAPLNPGSTVTASKACSAADSSKCITLASECSLNQQNFGSYTCSDSRCKTGCGASPDGISCKDLEYTMLCYSPSLDPAHLCYLHGVNGVWQSSCFLSSVPRGLIQELP